MTDATISDRNMQSALCGPRLTYPRTVSPFKRTRCAQFQLPIALQISSSLLLTAGLVVGQRARIFPLSGFASTAKLPPWLPSLRQAQEAASVRLREIPTQYNSLHVGRSSGSESQHNDWLRLSAREVLGGVFRNFTTLAHTVLYKSI